MYTLELFRINLLYDLSSVNILFVYLLCVPVWSHRCEGFPGVTSVKC